MRDMKLFTGNANPQLAQAVANQLNIDLGDVSVGRFSDGEITVKINENVRGGNVFIFQPTCSPTNDNLMELIIMADAFRRASASRITAVLPYYGYARQDRRIRSARVPITAKVVADLIERVGISRLLTVDLHADQIQGFFYVPVDNVYATPIFIDDIRAKKFKNMLVVSPDIGGVLRARATAKLLNDTELAIIDKRRLKVNQAEVMHIIGDASDRDCLIVDDIVDTAGTLCTAAAELKKNGANSVTAYCTHAVLSGNAIENIMASNLDEIVVSDTIPLTEQTKKCSRVRSVSIASMLAEAIKRVNEEESVSSMFIGS